MCLSPRHTDRFTRALALARAEAGALAAPALGTEHLMLGLVREERESGLARPAGVDPDELRAVLPRAARTGDEEPRALSLRAALAVGAAHRLAEERGERGVGADHLQAAVLGDPDCAAVAALLHLGVDVGDLWSRVLGDLDRPRGVVVPAVLPAPGRARVLR